MSTTVRIPGCQHRTGFYEQGKDTANTNTELTGINQGIDCELPEGENLDPSIQLLRKYRIYSTTRLYYLTILADLDLTRN